MSPMSRSVPRDKSMRAHPRTAPVAQVSKPAVSPISKSAGRCQASPRQRFVRPVGLEARDTEGLQNGVAGGNVRMARSVPQ